MESGLLSLKWNNHSSTFFHVLETIRRKELYSDVTIACDGKFFSVHKLVLSTCSEYFQEMFEKTNCKHPVIVLKDINYKDLESLLNYMYIGEVNVIQTELSSLIKAAECLKVKGLAVPDEPPPSNKRSSKRPITNDRDDSFTSSKRNRRSGSSSHQSHPNALSKEERVSTENISSTNLATEPTVEKENDVRHEEQSSNHNFKEYEPIHIKTEKEDTNTESYVDNALPPVSKFEYDTNSVDSTINPGLSERRDSSPYSSHLQQQPHSSEDSMGHLLPTTSRFHGESSSWGSDGLEESSKERGEGGSYDPNSYLLDNPQAPKSQVATPSFPPPPQPQPGVTNITPGEGSVITQRFMEKDGHVWKCVFPFCGYNSHSRVNLLNHVRKHTGEKPFSCDKCSYRSNQCSNLYTHLKRRHKE